MKTSVKQALSAPLSMREKALIRQLRSMPGDLEYQLTTVATMVWREWRKLPSGVRGPVAIGLRGLIR